MSDRNESRNRMAGFTMIELLITLVVVAVIASIAISNLIAAHDKARQGATVADMRSIANAIETYAVDHGFLPASVADFTQLEPMLEPYHTSLLPLQDHWGHVYHYSRDSDGYTIVSVGKDGVDGDDITPATKHEFTRDIVYSNGQFVAAP